MNTNTMVLSFAAITDVGVVRKNNEDNFYCNGVWRDDVGQEHNEYHGETKVIKQPKIFAVMDGMGGLAAGEIASLTAVRELDRQCQEAPSCDMLAFLMAMNDRVCEERRTSGERLGSTAVMARVDQSTVQFSNIGDSRGYLLHDGEMTCLTVDHSERGSLERVRENLGIEEALPENMRNGLTQYLGIFEDELIIEPELSEPQPLEAGDVILLSSDGLTAFVDEAAIREVLMADDSVEKMTARLVELAIERGSRDNITVILVRREG